MRTAGEGEDQVGTENVGKCLREEKMERRPWRKGKIRPPKGESGAPGLEGQGPRSGGGAPEPTAGSSLPPALSRATLAKAGAGLTRGERLLTCGTAPPHFSPSPGVAGPSLGRGDSGRGTLHPASSQVTWAAGSGSGGCRLSAPSSPGGSGSGPHAAALQGPDSAVAAAAEAAETLEGPAAGAGAPHYCFISRGPAKNNAGHETAGTRSSRLT